MVNLKWAMRKQGGLHCCLLFSVMWNAQSVAKRRGNERSRKTYETSTGTKEKEKEKRGRKIVHEGKGRF